MREIVRLGDVAKVVSGNGFPKKYQSNINKAIPFFKVSDMNLPGNEIKMKAANNYVSDYELKEIKAKCHPLGTVIFPKIGGAISTNKKRLLVSEAAFDNNVMGVIPNSKLILPEFLYKFFVSLDLYDLSNKAALPSITRGTVEDLLISLPSLADQREIVAKIDSAFAEIDKAINAVTKNIINIKNFIFAVLEEIFEIEKKDWETYTLDELCILERGSSPRPIKEFITENEGINWIKIGDASLEGKYIKSTKQKITKNGAEKSRYVKTGDLILTNSMSYGRPYIMATEGCIHDGWFVLRLNENVDSEYFFYLLSSRLVQNQFNKLAAGSVVKNISSDLVKRTKIFLPPKIRQIEIRDKIVRIEKYIEEYSNLLKLKKEALVSLKKMILLTELNGKNI